MSGHNPYEAIVAKDKLALAAEIEEAPKPIEAASPEEPKDAPVQEKRKPGPKPKKAEEDLI